MQEQPLATPVLEGARIRLTPFERRHLEDPAYCAWLGDREVLESLNLPRYWLGEVSEEEIRAYARGRVADPTTLFFALELKDQDSFIGTVKAGPIDIYSAVADLGIMIGEKAFWGRGLATDALSLLGRFLFEELSLRRLTAGSMASNPGMIRVFEKLGFKREGLFRQQDRLGDDYIDHIHLGCLRDEFVPATAQRGQQENRRQTI